MKPKTRLTIRRIAAMKPGTALWDTDVPGLHVRALKTGVYFYFYYRTRYGRQRKPSLGRFGAITLDQARGLARDCLADIAAGHDPLAGRQARKRAEAPTMHDLRNRWETDHADGLKSAHNMIRQWELHILPVIGHRAVRDITKDDITGVLARLNGHVCFNRVRALLSLAFNLAETWGWRDDYTNPVRAIKRKPELKRRRYLKPDEIRRLGAVLKTWRTGRRMKANFAALILLLLYTGARRGEIMTARWAYIDWHRHILDLPDSKTGAKEIILPAEAMALLTAMKKTRTNDFIIPARKGNKPLGHPSDLWKKLLAEADITNLRIHDLRHSFASTALSAAGGTLHQVGTLLGHARPETTSRYAHFMTSPKHRLAGKTAATLKLWMEGEDSSE